ncbi:tetratricopeptide repeat protein [Nannocystaceae bacterium ST9]
MVLPEDCPTCETAPRTEFRVAGRGQIVADCKSGVFREVTVTSSQSLIDANGRPGLVDYLRVASRDSLTFELRLRVGAIACGRLAIRDGRVIHAEMPGATGDLALELLGRVPNLRAEPGALGESEVSLRQPWTHSLAAVIEQTQDESAHLRRARVYAELRALGLGPPTDPPSAAVNHSFSRLQLGRARRSAARLLRRAGMLAYLAGDLERARRCYERALTLRPRDLESRANTERIRARMLDGENDQ